MDDSYQAAVAAVALAVLLTVSGCGQVIGGSSGPQYQGDASNYLLTAEEVGDGWVANGTRDPNIDPARIDSGRVVELENGTDSLQVTVLVFSSAANASAFLDDQRGAYNRSGLNATALALGDEAIGAVTPRATYMEVRRANVYVQVVGTVPPEAARSYVEAQLEKVRVVDDSA